MADKAGKDGKEKVDGTHLWLVLNKAYHAMSAYAAPTMRNEGLADADFRVLEALLHKGPLPVNTIGAKVFLTTGSISTAIDRLHTRGLVTRAGDKADRRLRVVDLTPKGRKCIERAFAAHAKQMNTLAEELSPGDRRRVAAALKELGKRAEQQHAKPDLANTLK
jgi:MarR family 2-MHQ and catechol resistance regulon transcriptional repressor